MLIFSRFYLTLIYAKGINQTTMLDIRFVRENTDKVMDALRKRGQGTEILGKFLEIEK